MAETYIGNWGYNPTYNPTYRNIFTPCITGDGAYLVSWISLLAIFGVAKSSQSPGMLKNSKNHGIPTEQRLMEKFQLTPKMEDIHPYVFCVGFTFVSLGLGQHFFFLPTPRLPEWFHWSPGADSRSYSVGGVHGGGGRRRAEVGIKIWTRESVESMELTELRLKCPESVTTIDVRSWGLKYPFFSYGRDGHPPRSPLMTLVFGWRLGLVFGRWTFKSRGLFQGLPVCKNLFDAIYSDLKKKTKSCKHSFTPPKSNECPLKINGWFRCISCWNGPFLGGHSLVLPGCKRSSPL